MAADSAHDADAVETVRQWVNSARYDEELIELEAQTLRAMLATHDATVAELERLRAERSERDGLEQALIEADAKNRRLLDRTLKAESEAKQMRAERNGAPAERCRAVTNTRLNLQCDREEGHDAAHVAELAGMGRISWHGAAPQQPERDGGGS